MGDVHSVHSILHTLTPSKYTTRTPNQTEKYIAVYWKQICQQPNFWNIILAVLLLHDKGQCGVCYLCTVLTVLAQGHVYSERCRSRLILWLSGYREQSATLQGACDDFPLGMGNGHDIGLAGVINIMSPVSTLYRPTYKTQNPQPAEFIYFCGRC